MEKVKSIYQEFKTFAIRGNVIDLAVGVIIGGAFGKITTSLVTDIFNPFIGILIGRFNFSNMFFSLDGKQYTSLASAQAIGAPVIAYGDFINTIIDFIITAIAIFIIIQEINRLKRHEDKTVTTEDPTTKKCPFCISTIPITATRCPACTSNLPPETRQEEKKEELADKQ